MGFVDFIAKRLPEGDRESFKERVREKSKRRRLFDDHISTNITRNPDWEKNWLDNPDVDKGSGFIERTNHQLLSRHDGSYMKHMKWGMSLNELRDAWVNSGRESLPSQEEYNNMLQWTEPTVAEFEFMGGTVVSKWSEHDGQQIRSLALQPNDIEQLDFLKNMGKNDLVEENAILALPKVASQDFGGTFSGQYNYVDELIPENELAPDYNIYFKREDKEWYEEGPWALLIGGAAALVTGGLLAPAAFAGAGAGTAALASGALAGAAGGATSAALTGNDVVDAALKGGITGGVSSAVQLVPAVAKFAGQGPVQKSIVKGGAAGLGSLAAENEFWYRDALWSWAGSITGLDNSEIGSVSDLRSTLGNRAVLSLGRQAVEKTGFFAEQSIPNIPTPSRGFPTVNRSNTGTNTGSTGGSSPSAPPAPAGGNAVTVPTQNVFNTTRR